MAERKSPESPDERDDQTFEPFEVPRELLPVYLTRMGFEVIDYRARSGGSLWVIAGQPQPPVLAALQRQGIEFRFAKNGSKGTGRRPAWLTKWVG